MYKERSIPDFYTVLLKLHTREYCTVHYILWTIAIYVLYCTLHSPIWCAQYAVLHVTHAGAEILLTMCYIRYPRQLHVWYIIWTATFYLQYCNTAQYKILTGPLSTLHCMLYLQCPVCYVRYTKVLRSIYCVTPGCLGRDAIKSSCQSIVDLANC